MIEQSHLRLIFKEIVECVSTEDCSESEDHDSCEGMLSHVKAENLKRNFQRETELCTVTLRLNWPAGEYFYKITSCLFLFR